MYSDADVRRFWLKVSRGEDCWLWTAAKSDWGYGVMRITTGPGISRNHRAHRISWEIAHGPIPDGLVVCHRCDVPSCVRPGHLFLGTKGENTADMMAKKRHRIEPLQGEAHGGAKLTAEQVREMRRMRERGVILRDIARAFGMSISQTHNIVTRHHWRLVG